MKKIIFAAMCMLLPFICSADGSAVQSAIAKQEFEIRVDMIYPQAGPSINADATYFLKFSGEKVTSYLPFFGESHTSIIANVDEPGIIFDDQPAKELKIEKVTKKKTTKYEISFTVDANSEHFDFFVEISEDGQATISCNSMNRSPMSYTGALLFATE